jgi:hypothetical protein
MSILRFLDGIFFSRTEKLGTKILDSRLTEYGTETILNIIKYYKIF